MAVREERWIRVARGTSSSAVTSARDAHAEADRYELGGAERAGLAILEIAKDSCHELLVGTVGARRRVEQGAQLFGNLARSMTTRFKL